MLRSALIFAVALALPLPALAAIQNFTMTIDNVQEQAAGNCLVGSTAMGTGTATLDTTSLQMTWSVTFGNNSPSFNNGLLDNGAESAAHFHEAAAGVNGPVRVNVGTGSPKAGSTTLSSADASALQAGNFYINIHSQNQSGVHNCGAGEIRGQVLAATGMPALSGAGRAALAAALLLGALAAWAARSRAAR